MWKGIRIAATGACLPARVVTNDDLSRLVDTSDEWITKRTGIRERRYCEQETHLDLGCGCGAPGAGTGGD